MVASIFNFLHRACAFLLVIKKKLKTLQRDSHILVSPELSKLIHGCPTTEYERRKILNLEAIPLGSFTLFANAIFYFFFLIPQCEH